MVTPNNDELLDLGNAIPADLLEQIEEAQQEAATAIDTATATTTAQAIETALSVAGIKAPQLKAEVAAMLANELGLLLHLAADACALRVDEPGLGLYDGLLIAIDERQHAGRRFRVRVMAGTMIEEFQGWLEDEKKRLQAEVEQIEEEVSRLAPLVKHARQDRFNTEMVADYGARCAALFEARQTLALIEAHPEALEWEDESQLENASEGMRLLWLCFVEGGGVDEFSRYK